MVRSKNYKGIEYVQLNELPVDQRERMKETFNKELFIKILVEGKVLSDCIQYKNYRSWFESIFLLNKDLNRKSHMEKPPIGNEMTVEAV